MKAARAVSLFDVHDFETQPRVADMVVGPVPMHEVEEFARRYHYTAGAGAAPQRYGLWHGPVLHGIVTYNLPTPTVCGSVFGPEYGLDHVWHMGRLILSDQSPRNSESRLIGGSLRKLNRQRPEVWAVLTYADARVGHLGYVYQATNAIYTGRADSKPSYLTADGQLRSPHNPSPRGTGWTSRDEARSFGWTVIEGEPKHRYVYILGSPAERRRRRKMLRLPVLPYPKAATT